MTTARLLLCLTGMALSAQSVAAAPADPAPNPGTALITGSDRGLGLALAQEFVSRGWQVIATCRDPSKAADLIALAKAHPTVSIEQLDVSDNAAIDALAAKLKGHPIDALINNAGVTGTFDGQTLTNLDAEQFAHVLLVNSYAPLRVASAFADLVAASKQRKIIGISSGYGSLASADSIASYGYPSLYFYAMSKAALNMGLREFALETASRGITTVMLSPGAVDTDMQRELRGYVAKTGKPITVPALTAQQSTHALVLTIEQLTPAQNAHFLSRDGQDIPW